MELPNQIENQIEKLDEKIENYYENGNHHKIIELEKWSILPDAKENYDESFL
ncbi:MAG: hypothetical protein LBE92_06380 [Chryseobacterium sp.]|jgi:hypothetical protein|uniref:hypothetical protein n=1 Tax=Chryseobacterium sp. TaxID=1871047 RepID=UPI00283266EA|nr:hypothetical protein [Chryseobacterium sp.]MDR2235731.1 hypothetical protein [Chryseobacterium sp.]